MVFSFRCLVTSLLIASTPLSGFFTRFCCPSCLCSYLCSENVTEATHVESTGFASKAPLRNSSLPSAYRHKFHRDGSTSVARVAPDRTLQVRADLRFGFSACSIEMHRCQRIQFSGASNTFMSLGIQATGVETCFMRLLYGTVHKMLPFLWQEEIAHACETLQRKGL